MCMIGLILIHPLYLSIFHNLDMPFFDNREISGLPVLRSPKDFFEATMQIDSFIADRLPFRNRIISALYWFRQEILHDYIFPQVVMGKNNWLYYSGYYNFDLYQQVMPFSQDELSEIHNNLESTQAWLSARNIQMIVVIVPEKETIYPEYLPGNIPVIGEISQIDQLFEYFSGKNEMTIIDLRPAIFERKKTFQTYFLTDTHWNEVGCQAGYEEIMREIVKQYPQLQPYPLSDFDMTMNFIQGDLLRFIGQLSQLETNPFSLNKKSPTRAQLVADDDGYWSKMMVDDPSLPRLLMFRDSFGFCLIPFLAEHFNLSLFQWAWPPTTSIVVDQELVEQFNPDIVIIEIAERYLRLRLLPSGNP